MSLLLDIFTSKEKQTVIKKYMRLMFIQLVAPMSDVIEAYRYLTLRTSELSPPLTCY